MALLCLAVVVPAGAVLVWTDPGAPASLTDRFVRVRRLTGETPRPGGPTGTPLRVTTSLPHDARNVFACLVARSRQRRPAAFVRPNAVCTVRPSAGTRAMTARKDTQGGGRARVDGTAPHRRLMTHLRNTA